MCEYMILEVFNMDKYIYDNSNGLWYELQGDYYIPCLVLPDEKEERHIGISLSYTHLTLPTILLV